MDNLTVTNTLILTVGLPRSGKTTWARQQGFPIVCPDSIRLSLHGQVFYAPAEQFVWSIAKIMVKSLFLAGHKTVILDATNLNSRRYEWSSKEWSVAYKVFDTSIDVCIERAKNTNPDLIPVIKRMADYMEPLKNDVALWIEEHKNLQVDNFTNCCKLTMPKVDYVKDGISLMSNL